MTRRFALVTGGTGFLGREVVRELESDGTTVAAIGSHDYDLRHESDVRQLFDDVPQPDLIIHCAAHVGGIGLNRTNPADLFYDNLMMGTLLLQYAFKCRVPKFVSIGTVCSYPSEAPLPFKEEDLWNGYPEPTNAAYGLAKRMLIVQAQALRQQYGYDAITVIPTNLYGPGGDSNLKTSHVIPAIIAKVMEAKKADKPRSVELWGSGHATRDFLHVRDAARGIVLAANDYSHPMPINLGGTGEVSILEVATYICKTMQFEGYLSFDNCNPDGQKRRAVSSERAAKRLNWKPEITLYSGLEEMIELAKV